MHQHDLLRSAGERLHCNHRGRRKKLPLFVAINDGVYLQSGYGETIGSLVDNGQWFSIVAKRVALSRIGENRMETLSRSWDLLGQSFAVLKSDKELMWLPVMSAMFCLAATAIILGIGLIAVMPPGPFPHDAAQQKLLGKAMAPFMFLLYFVTSCLAIYFNVALVSIASNRFAGGHATLNDGLQTAWKRKWSILQWALLATTVGILLQMLERRSRVLGRITTRVVGFAWTLASFFVVPLLAAEDMGPVEALYKSQQIFRKTWGEGVAGGFSFGLIFFLLTLPGLLLPIMGARLGQTEMVAGFAVAVIYWLLLGVVNSAARGIFIAALYRYATKQEVSAGYDRDDLSGAWQPKVR